MALAQGIIQVLQSGLLLTLLCLLSACASVQVDSMEAPKEVPSEVTPFLMFMGGEAEEAMSFYVSLFPNSSIDSIKKYDVGGAGPKGTVEVAHFSLGTQKIMAIDSPMKHAFGFTPAISMYYDCSSEEQLKVLFEALSKDGEIQMPLNNYGFSKKFGFCTDRFGVSWQLNLP